MYSGHTVNTVTVTILMVVGRAGFHVEKHQPGSQAESAGLLVSVHNQLWLQVISGLYIRGVIEIRCAGQNIFNTVQDIEIL